jgi:hypothetical protein
MNEGIKGRGSEEWRKGGEKRGRVIKGGGKRKAVLYIQITYLQIPPRRRRVSDFPLLGNPP